MALCRNRTLWCSSLFGLCLFGLIPHLPLLRLVRLSVHRADGRGKGVSTLSRVSRLGHTLIDAKTRRNGGGQNVFVFV